MQEPDMNGHSDSIQSLSLAQYTARCRVKRRPEVPVGRAIELRKADGSGCRLPSEMGGFFDNMSHEWTMKFIEHRVADRRILRLIQKWLKAGVSEDGRRSETKVGTPEGG